MDNRKEFARRLLLVGFRKSENFPDRYHTGHVAAEYSKTGKTLTVKVSWETRRTFKHKYFKAIQRTEIPEMINCAVAFAIERYGCQAALLNGN